MQHISLLEEKVAAQESLRLRRSVDNNQRESCVGDNLDRLEKRVHRAESELADIDHNRRSTELHENRKV